MGKIVRLFKELRSSGKKFLGSKKWDEFENQIEYFLRNKLGFTKIDKDTFREDNAQDYKRIRNSLRDKNFVGLMDKPDAILSDAFIFQPFGSQNFPDFLIFTERHILPVEIKFTSDCKVKPVWNSGVPMSDGIYIFWSYGLGDITFFRGRDILSKDQRKELVSFFEELKPIEHQGNLKIASLDEHNRWFQVYVRKAFDQKIISTATELNYFKHQDREEIEVKVIEFVASI